MQPKPKHFIKDVRNLAVNNKEFFVKERRQIPVDEVFFYRHKKVAVVKEKQKHNADEHSIEGVDDEEFEKVITHWKMITASCLERMILIFASNMKKKLRRTWKIQIVATMSLVTWMMMKFS